MYVNKVILNWSIVPFLHGLWPLSIFYARLVSPYSILPQVDCNYMWKSFSKRHCLHNICTFCLSNSWRHLDNSVAMLLMVLFSRWLYDVSPPPNNLPPFLHEHPSLCLIICWYSYVVNNKATPPHPTFVLISRICHC